MAQSATIKFDGVGPVLFERSQRAKHMNISVKPFKGIRVAVPEGLSFQKAQDFVQSKIDWIQINQAKIKQYEQNAKISSSALDGKDRARAKRRLTGRLTYLANQHGFAYNRVFIRNQKTRWGSCSQNNHINLNVKLTLLPEKLMDYVILHELVHTRIKNHSVSFWMELNKFVGDSKKLAFELKKFGIREI